LLFDAELIIIGLVSNGNRESEAHTYNGMNGLSTRTISHTTHTYTYTHTLMTVTYVLLSLHCYVSFIHHLDASHTLPSTTFINVHMH